MNEKDLLIKHCKETARLLDKEFNDLAFMQWEIGKIIFEAKKQIEPSERKHFIKAIFQQLEQGFNFPINRKFSMATLKKCEKFYERFPDLPKRVGRK